MNQPILSAGPIDAWPHRPHAKLRLAPGTIVHGRELLVFAFRAARYLLPLIAFWAVMAPARAEALVCSDYDDFDEVAS